MHTAPVSSERRSTAGRIARPADPTSPGGIVPPVHHKDASYCTTGHPQADGPRTILPYLLGGMAPPNIPYVTDRVVRCLTQTIVDLQRVMQSHAIGRLHGGEQVGK
eukprot:6469807-Prymnesium_polylepis.1